MEVVVQAHHPDAHDLRDQVVQRIRAVTQRLASFVVRAVIRMKDLNGPRGGVDKVCQVQLNTANGEVLVVSSRGPTWRTALELALARAARALWRRFNVRKPRSTDKHRQLSSGV